jgi:uncharacterized protein (UPF0333 family)
MPDPSTKNGLLLVIAIVAAMAIVGIIIYRMNAQQAAAIQTMDAAAKLLQSTSKVQSHR